MSSAKPLPLYTIRTGSWRSTWIHRWRSSSAHEEIGQVEDLDLHTRLFQAGADLQDATGVGRHHRLRAGLQNVFHLSALQPSSHFRFGQIVAARAAAADIRFGQFDKILSGNQLYQVAWLLGDLLWMGQVTGVVIGNTVSLRNGIAPCAREPGPDPSRMGNGRGVESLLPAREGSGVGRLWRRRTLPTEQVSENQELAQVFNLRAEFFCALGPQRVAAQQLAIFLERGTAARGVDYDRVQFLPREHFDIAARGGAGGFEIAAVR